jgi:hypothetical protein
MPLKQVSYKDTDGRYRTVLLPESEPEEFAELRGILIGPPDLSELGLPTDIEVRLNNELYHRGIIDAKSATRNRQEIVYAIQSALKVDADRIIGVYLGRSLENGSKVTEKLSNKTVSNRGSRQP